MQNDRGDAMQQHSAAAAPVPFERKKRWRHWLLFPFARSSLGAPAATKSMYGGGGGGDCGVCVSPPLYIAAPLCVSPLFVKSTER